ncbi:hypothetical protein FB451DRAFT_1163784 [Mycena latifolia]|nr:hypothetical protein FB451DRAFT_1163784 [Mycena latifolia]
MAEKSRASLEIQARAVEGGTAFKGRLLDVEEPLRRALPEEWSALSPRIAARGVQMAPPEPGTGIQREDSILVGIALLPFALRGPSGTWHLDSELGGLHAFGGLGAARRREGRAESSEGRTLQSGEPEMCGEEVPDNAETKAERNGTEMRNRKQISGVYINVLEPLGHSQAGEEHRSQGIYTQAALDFLRDGRVSKNHRLIVRQNESDRDSSEHASPLGQLPLSGVSEHVTYKPGSTKPGLHA